jgi:predicted phage terminase large subunit-like protein
MKSRPTTTLSCSTQSSSGWSFQTLKKMVLEEYKDWEPDAFVVEKKSNGAALYQEFRRMGMPVGEFTPGKGQDKIARVNAVSDLFFFREWYGHRTADGPREVIEECNDFPSGANDDLVDSTTQALMHVFRQGGFHQTYRSDEPDEVRYFKNRRTKSGTTRFKDIIMAIDSIATALYEGPSRMGMQGKKWMLLILRSKLKNPE